MTAASLPKAELHLHLEGAIRPKTVLNLAHDNGIALPYQDEGELERALAFDDFLTFLQLFQQVNECLAKQEDFERITRELADDLAAQQVVYAEVRYAPMHPMRRGLSFDQVTAGVVDGVRTAMREHPGLHLEVICGLTRQFGLEECFDSTRSAANWLGQGVVGIDIGGDEAGFPAELFKDLYALARAEGLQVTAHAGEAAGPESVWAAVKELGVRRVGHGIRSIEDPELVAYLRGEGITLEVCPTSNIRTKVAASYRTHPLRRLYDAGVAVTVSSDDPAMFQTNIEREYDVAAGEFGFTEPELHDLTRNAIRAGFAPASVRQQLLAGVT
ncbi:MAG: adenosine deaminase [Chloroflexota bacterium]|nr:adenosine deaminase [Chloroflexota bacterium]